ncbi:MAG: hypothetical protein LC624_01475, partial [Halobacteriales archaeon]|nr:hypothetical protein [Halobacteriales archaeon]
MMKHILVAGILAATAFAGVASALPCQSGSSPLGYYSVCLLGYQTSHYQYDCTVNTCGYDYHYVYDNAYNAPVSAFQSAPFGYAGVDVSQSTYSYTYTEDFFGYQYNGDGSGKNTHIGAQTSAGGVDFYQGAYDYTYGGSFGGGSGSGSNTDVGANTPIGSAGLHQYKYSYTSDCCGGYSGGATFLQLGPQQ